MTAPTTVWTILQKDRQGNPRGFEKGDGYYYLTKEDAEAAHEDMEDLRSSFTVVECVIMAERNYVQLVEPKRV